MRAAKSVRRCRTRSSTTRATTPCSSTRARSGSCSSRSGSSPAVRGLRQRLRREAFLVTPLAVIVNPVYIVRRGLLKAISALAPQIAGDVLDFGCGSKPYESLFTQARSYIGTDIRVSGHDHANSKVDVYYDGKTLPFPDGHFDGVVCFEVLEHVFNIDEVMREIG